MVLKQEIANQLRTKFDSSSIGGELFLAETNIISNNGEEAVIDLTFNANQCSYDYSWKSNRWSGPDITHVINIIALKNMTDSEFLVTSDCCSTPFVIASSHKKFIKPKSIADVENMAATMTDPNKKRKYTRREPVQNLDHLKKSKNGEGGGGNNINMTEELDINESANILLGFCGVGAPAFPSLATGSGDAFPSSSSQDPTSSHYTYSVLNDTKEDVRGRQGGVSHMSEADQGRLDQAQQLQREQDAQLLFSMTTALDTVDSVDSIKEEAVEESVVSDVEGVEGIGGVGGVEGVCI